MNKVELKKDGLYLNDENLPVFYHAKFKAQAGVDTFLDTKPFNRGFAVVNGFNVG